MSGLRTMGEDELSRLYREYIRQAHTGPKSGPEFWNVSQAAWFTPVNKAIEVREELIRRGLSPVAVASEVSL